MNLVDAMNLVGVNIEFVSCFFLSVLMKIQAIAFFCIAMCSANKNVF